MSMITEQMVEALKLAVRQNSHDMLMTGEELRQCEAALEAALSQGEAVAGLSWAEYWIGQGRRDVSHDYEVYAMADEWAKQRYPQPAPPAQGIDLGKVRETLARAVTWARRSDVTSHAEDAGKIRQLLALIDGRDAGAGDS